MFFLLLLVTLIVAALTSHIIVRFFDKPIEKMLSRIINDDISSAWHKYVKFAIYVTGISGGVKFWNYEKYLGAQTAVNIKTELTLERWTLEIYQTIIEALQSISWMLLVFFIFALIAYVIVKIFESKKEKNDISEK